MNMRGGDILLLMAALVIPATPISAASVTVTVGPSGDFTTLGAAAAAENPANTYTINMAPGTYTDDFAIFNAPTVLNAVGVTIETNTPPPNQKAVLTTTFPLTVNGLSLIALAGSALPENLGGNAAAIREQANGDNTLTVNGALIEGFQDGILTGSNSGNTHLDQVTIINTQFFNNGDPVNGQTHALYIGDAASLTVTGSTFCGTNLGHDVKSRAAQTTVTGSTLFVGTNTGAPAGCNVGSASLAIDMPNGGVGLVDKNSIFQGDQNQNGALIGYGEEGSVFTTNSLSVTRTKFTNLGMRQSIGINVFTDNPCPVMVSGTSSDTFTNITIPVNPPDCVAEGHQPHSKHH